MSESIAIALLRAAVVLADELDYVRPAEKLGVSPVELRRQIKVLETHLCLRLFQPDKKKVALTEEGKFLIEVLRKSVAWHDKRNS